MGPGRVPPEGLRLDPARTWVTADTSLALLIRLTEPVTKAQEGVMDRIGRLEDLLTEQAQQLQDQARELQELRAQMAAIDPAAGGLGPAGQAGPLAPMTASPAVPVTSPPPSELTGQDGTRQPNEGAHPGTCLDRDAGRGRTGRREVLRQAGAAAVGVAAGSAAAIVVGPASPAAAATGTFSGNPGVDASGVSGYGVNATSDTTSAIHAVTDTSAATIDATNKSGNAVDATGLVAGVHAIGNTHGVRAESIGYALMANGLASAKAQVYLTSTVLPGLEDPTTRTDSHLAGELYYDRFKNLWFCVTSGIPGTWRKIAGPSTAGALTVLPTPVRVYDSRPAFPPAIGTKSPLVASTARACDLKANSSGVPAGATAALVSLTATGTTGAFGGFLSIYRNGIAWPGTSSLNWSGPGQTTAVTTLTAVDSASLCALYANVATDVIVDVLAYYR